MRGLSRHIGHQNDSLNFEPTFNMKNMIICINTKNVWYRSLSLLLSCWTSSPRNERRNEYFMHLKRGRLHSLPHLRLVIQSWYSLTKALEKILEYNNAIKLVFRNLIEILYMMERWKEMWNRNMIQNGYLHGVIESYGYHSLVVMWISSPIHHSLKL